MLALWIVQVPILAVVLAALVFSRRRRLERPAEMCARCGRRPVHPNRASPCCDATCARLARECEPKLERVRANAREWLYTRKGD